jgi:hypothetical protein
MKQTATGMLFTEFVEALHDSGPRARHLAILLSDVGSAGELSRPETGVWSAKVST